MEWQRGLNWRQQFDLLGADGIDFHSIISNPPNCEIIDSFTKEEFLNMVMYPRTGYTFWKLIDGHKFYLIASPINSIKPAHKVSIYADVDYIQGHLRYGHYEGEIEIPNEEWESFKADPKTWIDEHDKDGLELVVDDWAIEGSGDIESVSWEEVKNAK